MEPDQLHHLRPIGPLRPRKRDQLALGLGLKRSCIQAQGPSHHIRPGEALLLRHETQALQKRLGHAHLKPLAGDLEIWSLSNKRQESGFCHG